jgi:hypothetical protein
MIDFRTFYSVGNAGLSPGLNQGWQFAFSCNDFNCERVTVKVQESAYNAVVLLAAVVALVVHFSTVAKIWPILALAFSLSQSHSAYGAHERSCF